jgi:hypothetical protein
MSQLLGNTPFEGTLLSSVSLRVVSLEEKDCFQEVAFTSTIDEMWERAGTWLS